MVDAVIIRNSNAVLPLKDNIEQAAGGNGRDAAQRNAAWASRHVATVETTAGIIVIATRPNKKGCLLNGNFGYR